MRYINEVYIHTYTYTYMYLWKKMRGSNRKEQALLLKVKWSNILYKRGTKKNCRKWQKYKV
jgi:hypothetical protein